MFERLFLWLLVCNCRSCWVLFFFSCFCTFFIYGRSCTWASSKLRLFIDVQCFISFIITNLSIWASVELHPKKSHSMHCTHITNAMRSGFMVLLLRHFALAWLGFSSNLDFIKMVRFNFCEPSTFQQLSGPVSMW